VSSQTNDDQTTTTPATRGVAGSSPLVARGVMKAFAHVPVLRGVDLEVAPGEIHALLGSNGSGKSTFVKLITGTYSADKGSEITLAGETFSSLTPQHARALGVRTVHQESPLIGQMTVAEHFAWTAASPPGAAWCGAGR